MMNYTFYRNVEWLPPPFGETKPLFRDLFHKGNIINHLRYHFCTIGMPVKCVSFWQDLLLVLRVCIVCAGVFRVQKRASGPLELQIRHHLKWVPRRNRVLTTEPSLKPQFPFLISSVRQHSKGNSHKYLHILSPATPESPLLGGQWLWVFRKSSFISTRMF